MEDQLESLPGACGLVARAQGARQTPGGAASGLNVGQAHLRRTCVYACLCRGAQGGGGDGWVEGCLLSPPAPAGTWGTQGLARRLAHL